MGKFHTLSCVELLDPHPRDLYFLGFHFPVSAQILRALYSEVSVHSDDILGQLESFGNTEGIYVHFFYANLCPELLCLW